MRQAAGYIFGLPIGLSLMILCYITSSALIFCVARAFAPRAREVLRKDYHTLYTLQQRLSVQIPTILEGVLFSITHSLKMLSLTYTNYVEHQMLRYADFGTTECPSCFCANSIWHARDSLRTFTTFSPSLSPDLDHPSFTDSHVACFLGRAAACNDARTEYAQTRYVWLGDQSVGETRMTTLRAEGKEATRTFE